MSKSEITKEFLEKYIDIAQKNNKQFSKRYLATVLANEHPEHFKDAEDARCNIRYYLNCCGDKNRIDRHEDLSRQFALIPEQIKEITNTEPYSVPTSIKKSLIIADVHGRFYNKKAFEISLEYALKQGCDSVIIDGDFIDNYQHSKFDKNPSVSVIFEEQEWGQDVLELLQNTFGSVFYKLGNHDLRRELHIQRLAQSMPELMSLSKISDYLFFDGCHVNFIEDYRHVIFGKLNIFHGHEYQGGGALHIAHNRFTKALDNILSAHSHRSQSLIKTNINGVVFGSWAIGCLCDLHPRYCPKNDWQNGFAIVEKDNSGDFEVNNRIIIGNKTVNS